MQTVSLSYSLHPLLENVSGSTLEIIPKYEPIHIQSKLFLETGPRNSCEFTESEQQLKSFLPISSIIRQSH